MPPTSANPPKRGDKRDGFLGIRGGMDGANIDHLLAACVGDPLVGERDDAQYDQSDPHKRYRINDASYLFLRF